MSSTQIINKVNSFLENKNDKDFHKFIFSEKNLSKKQAEEIFGLIYDYTNCFKNSNTTPKILEITGKLLECGLDHYKFILNKIKKTPAQMKFIGAILENINSYKAGKIIGGIVQDSFLKKSKDGFDLAKDVVDDILVTVGKANLVFLIIKINSNKSRIFLNSRLINSKIEKVKKLLKITSNNSIINENADEILKKILS